MKPAHSFWSAVSLSFIGMGIAPSAIAQIIPDGSLPSNSTVTPNGNTLTIDGGTAAGGNLFHSFQDFNVPTNGTAHFNNGLTIDNIITRVTGTNVSNIDGLIRANGTANLFVLNPAGLMFGPNASLEIGGSFVGSTAQALQFEDGSLYSAVDVDAPPLLTVNVPVGLQFGSESGGIRVAGGEHQSHTFRFENIQLPSGQTAERLLRDYRPPGLQVQPDRTLALVGGQIDLIRGHLTAESGRIELGSVAGNSSVTLDPVAAGWQLGYDGVGEFGDISLSGAASIDTSGPGSGAVQIQGRALSLRDGSAIVALTLGDEAGEDVIIRTTESIEFIGTTPDVEIESSLRAEVEFGATGSGGNVRIQTERFLLQDGAAVWVSTRGGTRQGEGNAGNFRLDATDVTLSGIRPRIRDGGRKIAGIFSRVLSGSAGNSGDIEVRTERFMANEGARISTETLALGNAGSITIHATESIEILTPQSNAPVTPSSLRASTVRGSSGHGGNVMIHADLLRVTNGSEIAATTQEAGNAGNLTIVAREIELEGTRLNDKQKILPSRLEAQVNRTGTGNGGTLTIETDLLVLRDGARISAGTFGSGNAGDVKITATHIELSGGREFAMAMRPGKEFIDELPSGVVVEVSSSGQGDGGNIRVNTSDLRLQDGMTITTAARNNSNGGNIEIDTDNLVLDDSRINANAFEGTGGNVEITARGIFSDTNSTITASSQLGIDGTIILNTPDVDPGSELLVRSVTPIDINALIDRNPCRYGQESQFLIPGRGGSPPTPRESLRGEGGFVELVKVDRPDDRSASDAIPPSQPTRLVEAQGWIIGDNGQVILTANPPNITPQGKSSVALNLTCQ